MNVIKRGPTARALITKLAAGAIAAATVLAVAGGLALRAAPREAVRLVGVTSQAAGKTAAVLIESSEPVAYSVSRPDPLTVLVDLRNVNAADAPNHVAKKGPVAGVVVEQARAADGEDLTRVRVSLASPSAYKVKSSRNVIRLDLEPEVAATPNLSKASMLPAAADSAAATTLDKVRASHTRTASVVTLAGNGRLIPSALSESDDQPRRLILDFPNVTPTAAAKTGVDSAFVKQVRVALDSREPLLTRVTMDISATATYHVERSGADGRDLAIVFEGPKPGGAVLVAPPSSANATVGKPDAGADEDEKFTLAQAMANVASIVPPDPIAALTPPSPPSPAASARPASPGPALSSTPGRQPPTAAPAAQQPPTAPPAQPPPTTQPQSTVITPAVPNTGQRQYVGTPVSFDFEDADLRAVLRVFAQYSGLNMIIDPGVQGRVNVLLTDVPWDQALEQILRANKLGYTVDGTIMRIAPLGVLADEAAAVQKLNEAKALAGELQVRTFPLSYAKAEAIGPLLTKSALSSRGQVQVDPRTNTLILMDLPDYLQTAQTLLGQLDKPQPQVEVQARVVQTNRDFARAVGIQWGFNARANAQIGNTTGLAFPNNGSLGGRVGSQGAGQGGTQGPNDPRGVTAGDNTATAIQLSAPGATSAVGLALGSINGAFNLDVALTALENSGKGRILSEPRLATQNNQQAVVRQGVQIPIQTVANNTVSTIFVNADLSLTVTPQITAANTVIMQIQLTNASPDFSRSVNGTPPINSQSATTTVQISDGETTVIGGIFVSQEQTSNDRTPVLYRVPILKWLFQRNTLTDSSRELLIFITPRIMRG